MRFYIWWVLALMLGMGVVTPAQVPAQWFADVYAGGALSKDETSLLEENIGNTNLSLVGGSLDLNFDPTFTVGVRVGNWFRDASWLGLALDASYFQPNNDVTVFPVSGLIFLRGGTKGRPRTRFRRLQPYAAIGVGAFVRHVDLTLSAPGLAGESLSDTTVSAGLDTRIGIAWEFKRPQRIRSPRFGLALFAEYRFTYTLVKFSDTIAGRDIFGEFPLFTNHLHVGLSFR